MFFYRVECLPILKKKRLSNKRMSAISCFKYHILYPELNMWLKSDVEGVNLLLLLNSFILNSIFIFKKRDIFTVIKLIFQRAKFSIFINKLLLNLLNKERRFFSRC